VRPGADPLAGPGDLAGPGLADRAVAPAARAGPHRADRLGHAARPGRGTGLVSVPGTGPRVRVHRTRDPARLLPERPARSRRGPRLHPPPSPSGPAPRPRPPPVSAAR